MTSAVPCWRSTSRAVTAALGLCQFRDQHHDRRSGYAVHGRSVALRRASRAVNRRPGMRCAATRSAAAELAHGWPPGNPTYLDKGYVVYDRAFPSKGMDVDPHGGSATLEYALADCAFADGRWPRPCRTRRRCVSAAATGAYGTRRCVTPRPASPVSPPAPRMASGTPGRWLLQPALASRFP